MVIDGNCSEKTDNLQAVTCTCTKFASRELLTKLNRYCREGNCELSMERVNNFKCGGANSTYLGDYIAVRHTCCNQVSFGLKNKGRICSFKIYASYGDSRYIEVVLQLLFIVYANNFRYPDLKH